MDPNTDVLGKSKLNTNATYPEACLYEKLKKKPEVTCICPTANRQDLISVAIQSFLSQTYTDSELLIVDDGDFVTRVPRRSKNPLHQT